MDKNFTPLKLAFEKHQWDWEESENLFKCINVRNKNRMWLYDYNFNVLVPRNHKVLVKCRGIVVQDDGVILNYPFNRFFNEREKEHADINWRTAIAQEKIDGSLLNTFWNGNSWEASTRGSFYPNDFADIDFAQEFWRLFKRRDNLNKDFCYMFELVSELNRNITYYDSERVYLIGARNLNTLQEVSQEGLDIWAKSLDVWRPMRYNANDFIECKKLFEHFKDDDEGLVVVDDNFNRVKLKQESYLKLVKIKALSEQDIFDYVLGKVQVDIEYLQKLPEVTNMVKFIKLHWCVMLAEIMVVFEENKNKATRKEFALAVMKYPYKHVLFALLDNSNVSEMNLKWEDIKTWFPMYFDFLKTLYG